MYEFGPFRIDPKEQVLWRDGKVVPLSPKLFDTLTVLVQNSGHLVDKDELLRRVWPDSFVEEGNLTKNVFLLRKILEDGQGVSYIETVPKRGYRFVAEVKTIQGNGSGSLVAEATDRKPEVRDAGEVGAGPENTDPKKRTPSLNRWLILAGAVILCVGIGAFLLVQRQATTKHPEIKSIVVLPSQNLSGDPAQEYFADGMTEALISNLAQISALRVVSRTSAMTFKGSKKPLLPEIARELGVDGVIESSVQRENGRVKVTIQLIHGPTDTHLWARSYERALTDVLKLQDEIARAIAKEIHVQVTPEEQARLSSAGRVNPGAYQEYLLGRFHFWKFIVDDHRRAVAHFERATQIDPSYAAAYAGLSLAWQKLGLQEGRNSFKEVEPQARLAAGKALELDDRLPDAHVSQGNLQMVYDWDWKRAENSFRRAIELDSNNLDAHFSYSLLLMALGRFSEAITEIQTAERLDPLSHQVQIHFARILLHAGKADEAVPRLEQAIEREPRSRQGHVRLAQAYEQMGKYTEALDIYDKARVLGGNGPDNSPFLATRARIYAQMGKRSEATRILTGLKLRRPDSNASVYAALGDKDEAFRLLFRMIENRGRNFTLKTEPQFASLHSDPRWRELMQRMNLPVE